MSKLVLFPVLFLLTMWSQAQSRINSFEDLVKAVKEGKEVRAVFDYSKCRQISDNEEKEKPPEAIGGMSLEVFEYFAPNSVRNKKAFLVSSESKLIEYPQGDGYVYNYVKIKVSDDNSVKITARYLDARTFEVKMDENFFSQLNDGKNDGAVTFFTE